MSQVITNAFEQYWQSCLAAEKPVVLDEFILADIPNLDITSPIDPETGLPPESQIVHRQNVDQRGRINNNAVAYTIVMDTTVGDFSFNAMYLRNKANGVIGMIVYKGRETKLKTDQTTGQTGNSLVKSMLMGYDQAAEATLTNVDAGTWQIDYAARLRGMDEDIRQLQADLYGHHTFVGDGFKVVEKDGAYQVSQGVAIIGGLRVELKAPEVIHPGTKPIGVWVDVHRAGSLLSEHQNHFTIISSVADLTDHVDSNGYQHYVAKLATVLADGTIEDGRGSAGGGNGGAGSIPDTFALWKRSMAEAGYDLIGQFGTALTIETPEQVVLSKDGTDVFAWAGALPKDLPENATIENSGGIGSSTWVSKKRSLLRSDLAGRWANSGADKKEVMFDLPLLFPDYDAILSANPNWEFIYPGSFTKGPDGKIYIAYGPSDNASTKRFVVVYSATGNYLGYFQTNNGGAGVNSSAVSEGIVVTSFYGGVKLFLGSYDGDLYEYDITTAAYGSSLTNIASHQVGLYNQFSFLNGTWAVEQAVPSNGQIRQRNVIAYFDSKFALTGFTELDPYDAGYITSTTTAYGELMTKRQGICLAPGMLIGSFGGVFIKGTSVEQPTNYQGVKGFSTDGSKAVEAMLSPAKFISAISETGRVSTRIENEGVCYANGEVMTLWIYNDRFDPDARARGILITKEFSLTPNLDLSDATVVSPGYNARRLSEGVFPRVLEGSALRNPITGKNMTTMKDVLEFLRLSGQKSVMIYTSSTPLVDLDGAQIITGTAIRIESLNNLSFKVCFTSARVKREKWISFIDPDYAYSNTLPMGATKFLLDGSTTGNIKQGRVLSNVMGGNPDVDDDQVLVIDQQHNQSSGLSSLIIGGASGLHRSATSISFATNHDGSSVGGDIRWRIDETSLRPFADNAYSVGNSILRPTTLYAVNNSISTSDARKKTGLREMSDQEMDAFAEILRLPGVWQWLDKYQNEGDEARLHSGPTVQAAIEIMGKYGLVWNEYSAFCYDSWDDQFEPVMGIRVDDETGVKEEYDTGEKRLVVAKGDLYSFRKNELVWWCMRALANQQDQLNERLKLIESRV
ncbi:phage tail protein [Aeromonas veronii]